MSIEWTGNIQVHTRAQVVAEDMWVINTAQAALINRLVQDQNNPDGDIR